jgi:ATP-dependent DNA helicase DinG
MLVARQEQDESYIRAVFSESGFLSAALSGYIPRPGQMRLVSAVDLAITEAHHLVAEGPTGTGKSIAYLVPSIYHVNRRTIDRALVVTSNKALQSQLVNKDLPLLKKALPWPFTYAMLKGKKNYLCRRMLKERMWEKGLRDVDQIEVIRQIESWAHGTESGDVSTLPLDPGSAWEYFSVSSEDCKRNGCPKARGCFYNLAKEAAEKAQILVVNYDLLLSHLQFERSKNPDSDYRVLPKFDVAVLDEGHNTADIARGFFGDELTIGAVVQTAGRLHFYQSRRMIGQQHDGKWLRGEVIGETQRFFDDLALLRSSPQYKSRLRPGVLRSERLEGLLRGAAKFYEIAARTDLDPRDAEDTHRLMRRSTSCADRLERFRVQQSSGLVYYLEEYNHKGVKQVKLASQAIRVAGYLDKHLFSEVPTAIITSATLAVGGKFDHLKREIGCGDAREIVVESPFDWQKQALLVVDESMPEPNSPGFLDAAAKAFARIVEMAKGRTLGLFTSWKMVDRVDQELKHQHRYPILRQGQGLPREQLIERFRREHNSVLIGTKSLWEGVDIPGDSLICVVLDRLPFKNPDDPVMRALEEDFGEDTFNNYSIPGAVIAFKQGFGRLIRSVSDSGVVVCLDSRIWKKSYGKKFLAGLPKTRVERSIDAIEPFLRSVRGDHLQA